jgi:hypothetical protein
MPPPLGSSSAHTHIHTHPQPAHEASYGLPESSIPWTGLAYRVSPSGPGSRRPSSQWWAPGSRPTCLLQIIALPSGNPDSPGLKGAILPTPTPHSHLPTSKSQGHVDFLQGPSQPGCSRKTTLIVLSLLFKTIPWLPIALRIKAKILNRIYTFFTWFFWKNQQAR